MNGSLAIQTAFNKILEIGYTYAIFDMQDISYTSSMGIGVITNFASVLAKKKGKLVIMNIQPKVLDVFSLLGLTRFLTIANSLEEAIKVI